MSNGEIATLQASLKWQTMQFRDELKLYWFVSDGRRYLRRGM